MSAARDARLAACNRSYGNIRAIYRCDHGRDHEGPHENRAAGLRWSEVRDEEPTPCPWGCVRPESVTDGAHLCDGAPASHTVPYRRD